MHAVHGPHAGSRATSGCRRALTLLLPTLCIAPSAAAAQEVPLARAADAVFAAWNSTHTPGCAVGVSQGGRTVLTRAYGMADLTHGIALTPATILESGSVAKQFTATAVLLLMQQGKLRLDDDARTYLPELPVYPRTVTIRHLLTHTSGLREWSNLVAWQGWPRGTRLHTQSDAFDLITRQRALNYPVGDFYSYTNSGFLLLRTIVERVSGQSFAAFTTARIFEPLGMAHTSWRDDYTRVTPGLAQAYTRRADGWHLDMPNDNVIAAGGLLTTVADWLRWNEALTTRELGEAWADAITRRMTLTSGRDIQYALGLTVGSYRGVREIGHSGATAGYSTFLARYPEKDNLSIAVLCNAAGAPATSYVHALVDSLYPDLPRTAAPDTTGATAPAAATLTGIFRDTRTNTLLEFEAVGARVRRVGGAVVRVLRDGTLQAGAARYRPVAGADGVVRTLRAATSDGDSLEYVRVGTARWVATARELDALAGRYRNDEIGVTYDVRVVTVAAGAGALSISPRAGVADTVVARYRDGGRHGFANGGESVWFERDARGRVASMHFGSDRAWNFVSVRVP